MTTPMPMPGMRGMLPVPGAAPPPAGPMGVPGGPRPHVPTPADLVQMAQGMMGAGPGLDAAHAEPEVYLTPELLAAATGATPNEPSRVVASSMDVGAGSFSAPA